MNAEDTPHEGGPQNMGNFLFRVVLFAAPLSIAFAGLPAMLVALSIARMPSLADVFVILLFAILGIAWVFLIALFIATLVVAAIGIPLWRLFCRDRPWTRTRATQLGAIAGAIVGAIEVAYLLLNLAFGASYVPGGFHPIGLAFGTGLGPSTTTWLKLAFDVVMTVGIGALSARLAWRPPTPPSETTGSPQA